MENEKEIIPIFVKSLHHKNILGENNNKSWHCYMSNFQAHRGTDSEALPEMQCEPTSTRPNRVNRNVIFQSSDGT